MYVHILYIYYYFLVEWGALVRLGGGVGGSRASAFLIYSLEIKKCAECSETRKNY